MLAKKMILIRKMTIELRALEIEEDQEIERSFKIRENSHQRMQWNERADKRRKRIKELKQLINNLK